MAADLRFAEFLMNDKQVLWVAYRGKEFFDSDCQVICAEIFSTSERRVMLAAALDTVEARWR